MTIEFYLPGMLEGEEIKIFLRKHLMFLAAPLATISMMMILPIIGILILISISVTLNQYPIRNFIIIFTSIYLLLLCGTALFVWFRYYYSYLIVTNMRLIEIEQKSLFDRVTSELDLLRVEDVKALVRGILATFLRYGDVLVETAGATTENFLFEKIPKASYVGSQILELSKEAIGDREPELGGRMASVVNKPLQPKKKMPKDNNISKKGEIIYSNINPNLGKKISSITKEDQTKSRRPSTVEKDQTKNGVKKTDNITEGKILYERDKDKGKSSGSEEIKNF